MGTHHDNPALRIRRLLMLCILAATIPFEAGAGVPVADAASICMHAQSVLKNYALSGMAVPYQDPAAELLQGIDTIDSALQELKGNQKLSGEMKGQFDGLDRHWLEIKQIASQPPQQARMLPLHDKVEEFVTHCDQVSDHLASSEGSDKQRWVMKLLRLGMQSQRLASHYMLKVWDVAGNEYYAEVDKVVAEYEGIYQELLNADDKQLSPRVKQGLTGIERDFIVFKAMVGSKSGRVAPTVAARNAARILQSIQEMVVNQTAS